MCTCVYVVIMDSDWKYVKFFSTLERGKIISKTVSVKDNREEDKCTVKRKEEREQRIKVQKK